MAVHFLVSSFDSLILVADKIVSVFRSKSDCSAVNDSLFISVFEFNFKFSILNKRVGWNHRGVCDANYFASTIPFAQKGWNVVLFCLDTLFFVDELCLLNFFIDLFVFVIVIVWHYLLLLLSCYLFWRRLFLNFLCDTFLFLNQFQFFDQFSFFI